MIVQLACWPGVSRLDIAASQTAQVVAEPPSGGASSPPLGYTAPDQSEAARWSVFDMQRRYIALSGVASRKCGEEIWQARTTNRPKLLTEREFAALRFVWCDIHLHTKCFRKNSLIAAFKSMQKLLQIVEKMVTLMVIVVQFYKNMFFNIIFLPS